MDIWRPRGGVGRLSKYQAALCPLVFWPGSSFTPLRGWLRLGGFWLAVVLAYGALPVFLWNMTHDWASFAFQGGRVGMRLNMTGLRL